ncbi:hypothetical protein ABZX95_33900 [Streptomyces sp. NPDC004232]|uniref:hypothetical protein n=1 Tax=Streptomyces sp. NPDC004232 TaxID=3154454 RepID=UPI0033BA201A
MKIFTSRRQRRVGWSLGGILLTLYIVAQTLYSTGVYASWRDQRSLDSACDGTLAQGGLGDALNSSHVRARAADDSEYLAACLINRPDTGRHGGALQLMLRWSDQSATSGALLPFSRNANGLQGQAAPLGNGWPGYVRYDGSAQVVVALDCQNNKNRALVAYGDLIQWPDDAKTTEPVLTGLGRVTTETAQKAAAKYGCQAQGGRQLTHVSLPSPNGKTAPQQLAQAQGSCVALRGLAGQASDAGTPGFVEYPTDAHTPQVNCYLYTPAGKPGYGLYAYYGAVAKDFESVNLANRSDDYALATARCPQSDQEAVFALYHLYDRDTDSYPVRHYSASFAKSALKAFAEHEAKQRVCTDVRMMSRS